MPFAGTPGSPQLITASKKLKNRFKKIVCDVFIKKKGKKMGQNWGFIREK